MASSLMDKYRSFMNRRNGPDRLARDTLILALILVLISVFCEGLLRTVIFTLGLVTLGYSYWRLFSSNVSVRRQENQSYITLCSNFVNKIKKPFKSAQAKGQKAAAQAKDKDHRYFACPKCGQNVRVPKGAGKIRVTCPKCGEKFERKA